MVTTNNEEINKKFHLSPGNFDFDKEMDYLDKDKHYELLLKESQKHYLKHPTSNKIINDSQLCKNHSKILPNTLTSETVHTLINTLKDTNEKFITLDIKPILKEFLSTQMDQMIKSYFKSNYLVLWYSLSTVTRERFESGYSSRWHCDAGPKTHLKTITYLNSTDDHGSTTYVADLDSTKRFKELGYGVDIEYRVSDLTEIANAYNIKLEIDHYNYQPGDTLIFNPVHLLHKLGLPFPDKSRYCFNLCLVPFHLPWDEAIEAGFMPYNRCIPFERLDINPTRSGDGINHVSLLRESVIEPDINKSKPSINIYIDNTIKDHYSLKKNLMAIFHDKPYVDHLFNQITKNGEQKVNFTIDMLLLALKERFQKDMDWNSIFSPDDNKRITSLLNFESSYLDSFLKYEPKDKPKSDAVFWPSPVHEKRPLSRFDMLPYINSSPLMTKNTPVASAGSCFAIEIAFELQSKKFNYLVAERPDNPNEGVIVDGYKPGDKLVRFSANYGIIFNSPTLLQLAEKAFNKREFTKFCIDLGNQLYTDPYRENVFFRSPMAFELDYPKHIRAIKKVLTESEVFVFTAGLNECWQLFDGSYISRNPKHGLNHLLKHRVLSVQDNIQSITRFFDIVKEHNKNFKLILALSPIPLLATGRAKTHHIIEANTHSKAVLRVALEEAAKYHEDIYYFPSYELVTQCTEDPWAPDHRHVTRETVKKVVSMFDEMFVSPD